MMEEEATFKYSPNTPKFLLFHNSDFTNAYGNAKAYRLVPQSVIKLLLPDDYALAKAFSWAHYQVMWFSVVND